MIIVVSPNINYPNEPLHVNNMLDNGLELFHFRKYGSSDELALEYLDNIDVCQRRKIVLHSHHHLASEFTDIERLHFNSYDRMREKQMEFNGNFRLSTSTHSIQEFNELKKTWSYAFLSPIFQSISKPGHGVENSVFEDIELKDNANVDLIGLGGIEYQNMERVLAKGSNGIALLGSIWNQIDPTDYLITCNKKLALWRAEQQ
ncbi:thiamine phosphate synthase [Sphingobacterium mizutaii NBRC 14946 = DSM 11724]|uniref:Regulatory protein tenI n=2 Tax=Sphingobacterium mizutaii TaxID=1010 RepID=A0AAJ4XBV2_9SPHI|nr:thiamine phosphate synthase [Sphingobacterium mizutaii]GEM69805.1 thiamine phosphate synthase [Sphingobacterium mizutaii NBRC 14946 = DSM 11724]SDK90398.1 thiamine-phosphate pyrophosphorylase [Sphingobacterium mizutaii]SNV47312.1 Regulatory protein tenI [Sphingobacterium mizutaii]